MLYEYWFLLMKFYLVGFFKCISMYLLTMNLKYYCHSLFNTFSRLKYSITRFGQKGILWLRCQNIKFEYIKFSKILLIKISKSENVHFIVHFITCLFLKISTSENVHFRKCPFPKLSISENVHFRNCPFQKLSWHRTVWGTKMCAILWTVIY